MGLATIVVSRKQPSGNFIAGVYHQEDDLYERDSEDHLKDQGEERPFRKYIELYEEEAKPEESKSGEPDTVQLTSFQINYDAMDSEYDHLNADQYEEIHAAIDKVYPLVHTDPEKAVELNKAFIERYPNYPAFYNYLVNALTMADCKEEANQVTRTLYQKFPEYLFAKLGYAHWLLDQERYEEALQVVDHKYTINMLYTDREVFHFSKVLAFNLLMCRYFILTSQAEKAINYYKIMLHVAADHPMTLSAEEMLGMALMKDDMLDMLSQWKQKTKSS